MRPLIFVSCVLLLICGCMSPAGDPFSEISQFEESVNGRWATHSQEYKRLFREELRRLGNQASAALPEYLDGNQDRHYWCSTFLEDADIFKGERTAQRHVLALLILEQGLALIREEGSAEEVMDAKASKVSMNYRAAILARKLGFHPLAAQHKARVKEIIAKERILHAALPACSEEDRALYDAIK